MEFRSAERTVTFAIHESEMRVLRHALFEMLTKAPMTHPMRPLGEKMLDQLNNELGD